METCLDCWHAGEGTTTHCGQCPCCKPAPQRKP